ncbi:unnamed protein product [Urochloa humidicola]
MSIERRGIKDVDTRCPVCRRLNEDGGHCFLKCKFVKRCWQALNMESVRLSLVEKQSSREVVDHILKMRVKERTLVISLLWVWWDVRNKFNAGEKQSSTEEVVHRTMELALRVERPPQTIPAVTGVNSKRSSWLPPPPDVLKINTDGAFREEEKDGAWGCGQGQRRPWCSSWFRAPGSSTGCGIC